MKKHVFSLGLMLVAALAFTNCNKQEVIAEPDGQPAASAGVPFELSAGVDTKTTTTDGATINWAANDALNVFVAEHDGSFSENKKFTSTDGSKTFKGELDSALDGAKTYDWKVVYPYDENILTVKTHSGTKGYLTLGSKTSSTQVQAGNDSKAHLAGSHMPLYGVEKNVDGDSAPSVSLSQVMSVVKVHVTNATESPLVVSTVNVAAPAGTLISGTFFLDFSGDTPVFESSGASYTSNVAKLTVTDGDAIDKNGTADFYVAIKPFTQASAGVLTVSVNGYEKDITIPAATEFKPGKIKTVNFAYDYVSLAEPTSKTGWYRVEDASWLKAGDRVLIAANGSDFAMSTTQNTNNRGVASVTKSTDGDYSTLTAGSDVQMFILEEGTVANSFAFKADNGDTADGYIYAASSGSNHLKTQDTKDANASFTVTVDTDGNASVVAKGTNTHNVMQYNSGSSIFACYTSASQYAVAIYKYYGTYVAAPVISVTTDNPMAVANTASSPKIEYTIDNATAATLTAALKNPADTWISNIDYSTDGEVSFDVAAQAAGDPARSAVIVLSYTGADDVEVTVNQAAGAGATLTSTLTFTAKCGGSGTADDGTSWTVTSDGSESNFDSDRGIHYGTSSAVVQYIKLTTSEISGTITKIVVNASAASSATVSVKVGDAAFGGDPQSLSSSANDYTFNGSASGSIEVTVTKPSSAKKALYVKSVTVTYTPAP